MPEIQDLVVTPENICKLRKSRRPDTMKCLPEERFDYCADSQRSSCYTNSPFTWFEAIKNYIVDQQTYHRCELKKNREKAISMCKIYLFYPQTGWIDLILNFVSGVVSVKGISSVQWIENDFETIRNLAHNVPVEPASKSEKVSNYPVPGQSSEEDELEKPTRFTSDIGTSDTDGSGSDFTLDEELHALWACCSTIRTNLQLLGTIIDSHPVDPEAESTKQIDSDSLDTQPTETSQTDSNSVDKRQKDSNTVDSDPTDTRQKDPKSFDPDLVDSSSANNNQIDWDFVPSTFIDFNPLPSSLSPLPPLPPPNDLLTKVSTNSSIPHHDNENTTNPVEEMLRNKASSVKLRNSVPDHGDRVRGDTEVDSNIELILTIDSNTRYLDHERLWINDQTTCHRQIRNLKQLNTFIDVNKLKYPNLKYFFMSIGCSDLETMSGAQVFHGIKLVVEKLRTSFLGIAIILSEITPRMDELDLQVKATNTLLHQYVEGNEDLFIVHNSNMRNPEFFEDCKHFRRSCINQFAENINRALDLAYEKDLKNRDSSRLKEDRDESLTESIGTELRYDEVANKDGTITPPTPTTTDYDYSKYVDKIKPLLYDAELVANLYIRLSNKYSNNNINIINEKETREDKTQHIHSAQIAYDVIKENNLTNFSHVVTHLLSYLGAIKSEKPIPENASIPNLLSFLEEMVKRNTMTSEHVTMLTCFLARPNRALLPHSDLRTSFLLTCFKQELSQLNVHTDERTYLRTCFIKLCEYFVQLDMTLTHQLTGEYLLPHLSDTNSTTFIMDALTYMGLVKSETMVITTQDITSPLILLDFIFVSKRMSLLTSQKLYAFIQLNNPRFKFCSTEREAVANTLRNAIDF